ncbi:hypothetical protein N0V93_002479 [Gnomoniopsis smithogilvyi]|uniref:Carbohydrate esterase family 16 protein n=1 Tax=Gnomoniopsis smithogilvyi TaxID=1191159 RepID=A0A9W8YWT3_9PEZI|nr:hypothetical protein N0V93_002479 [Gnomoniopsis smithogilvyi]
MKLIRPALTFAAEAWCSLAVVEPTPPACCSSCKTTSSWPGFSGINNIFSFGDSYTTTNFDFTGQQPTPDNPLGNPPYPGMTSALPAPNWIDFLTVKYNQSSLLTYNLAVGGATVDSDLVFPFFPTVLSLKEQVHQRFVPGYNQVNGSAPLTRSWHGNDTLFAFWIGINDVNGSYGRGPGVTGALNRQIMAVYRELLRFLFEEMGMRNFVLLNVPSIDRSPLMNARGSEEQRIQREDLADFNGLILKMARDFKKEVANEGNIWVYDSNTDFSRAMEDPKSFPQTSLLKNTTDSCDAYGPVGTPEQDTFYDVCGVPVNEYFWLNALHPTYPIHEAVAAQIAKLLEGSPNVC